MTKANWKGVIVVAVSGLALIGSGDPSIAQQSASGSPAVSAPATPPPSASHPTLENVLAALHFAKFVLGQKRHGSSRHRSQAIKYVDRAISEVNAAVNAGER